MLIKNTNNLNVPTEPASLKNKYNKHKTKLQ